MELVLLTEQEKCALLVSLGINVNMAPVCQDLVPLSAGIEAGCGAIMVSHTIVNCMDSEYPASLSPRCTHLSVRLDSAVIRILHWKLSLGLLKL